MILEITEHGAYLTRDHERFVVKNKDNKIEVPATKVDAIVISSNAAVSTSAIELCLEREIQLVITNWSGRAIGRFWHTSSGKNCELRRRQYLAQDSPLGTKIAERILEIKLQEQRKLLTDLKHNRKNTVPELEEALRNIESGLVQVRNTKNQLTKQSMLGVEGNAANKYFRAISTILFEKFKFKERSQHPAKDEFNALLNYGYGIIYRETETVIIVSGLDPNAGIYHVDQYGKPTLSYDVTELFRSKVDRLAVSLITKRKAKDDWFEKNETECSLTKIGRQAMINEYHEKIQKTVRKESWSFCRWIIEELLNDAK